MNLVARTAKIAADARAAQPTKAENRDSDPQFARFVDECRRRFGGELMYVRWPDGREWRK